MKARVGGLPTPPPGAMQANGNARVQLSTLSAPVLLPGWRLCPMKLMTPGWKKSESRIVRKAPPIRSPEINSEKVGGLVLSDACRVAGTLDEPAGTLVELSVELRPISAAWNGDLPLAERTQRRMVSSQ